MQVADGKRLKELETENRKLKQLLAEAHLDNAALKRSPLKKTGKAHANGGRPLNTWLKRRCEASGGPVSLWIFTGRIPV